MTTMELLHENGKELSFDDIMNGLATVTNAVVKFMDDIQAIDTTLQIAAVSMLYEEYAKRNDLDVIELIQTVLETA